MDRCRIGLILVVLLAVGCGVGMSEIHRAKSLNVKPRPHHHSQYQYPSPRDAILSVCQSIWRFTFCVLRCLEHAETRFALTFSSVIDTHDKYNYFRLTE